MLLLPQVKRETLQATKYVELLLVADYAEVRKRIMFILTEHWTQSKHPTCSFSWGGGTAGAQHVSSCHPDPHQQTGELWLVPFVLAATTPLPPLSATVGPGRDAGCDLDEGTGL